MSDPLVLPFPPCSLFHIMYLQPYGHTFLLCVILVPQRGTIQLKFFFLVQSLFKVPLFFWAHYAFLILHDALVFIFYTLCLYCSVHWDLTECYVQVWMTMYNRGEGEGKWSQQWSSMMQCVADSAYESTWEATSLFMINITMVPQEACYLQHSRNQLICS